MPATVCREAAHGTKAKSAKTRVIFSRAAEAVRGDARGAAINLPPGVASVILSFRCVAPGSCLGRPSVDVLQMASLNALALRLQCGLPPLVQKHLQKPLAAVDQRPSDFGRSGYARPDPGSAPILWTADNDRRDEMTQGHILRNEQQAERQRNRLFRGARFEWLSDDNLLCLAPAGSCGISGDFVNC
jgi:hypothetical protein